MDAVSKEFINHFQKKYVLGFFVKRLQSDLFGNLFFFKVNDEINLITQSNVVLYLNV